MARSSNNNNNSSKLRIIDSEQTFLKLALECKHFFRRFILLRAFNILRVYKHFAYTSNKTNILIRKSRQIIHKSLDV